MLRITTNETDIRLAEHFTSRPDILVAKLADKMLEMMTRLQEKARAGVPSSRVKESIENPSVEIQGKKIIGSLQWGNVPVSYEGTGGGSGITYDLAQIFEHGAKPHTVYPLTGRGTRTQTGKFGTKLKTARRFGQNVLHWGDPYVPGSDNAGAHFAPYAFHPAITGLHFMENAVESMRSEIHDGLRATIYDYLE